MVIPPDINNRGLLDAARFYRDQLRWTVQALLGPEDGADNERGKRPIEKGWKNRKREDATDAYLLKYFGNGTRRNLGLLVQLPHTVIDLDSKPDGGESVRRWLADHPQVAAWPRERTTGGAHLHVLCPDVPPAVVAEAGKNQKIEVRLTDAVTCEVFLGGNVVLAPSMHKSGAPYQWEQTGPLPTVPWAEIARAFAVPAPQTADRPAGAKRRSDLFWITRFAGDLRTLDIVKLATALGLEPRALDADTGKHAIRCPWADAHTTPPDPRNDSGTVLFEARDGRMPGFKCLHVSHGEKSLADFLNWCEDRQAGVVDAHSAQTAAWQAGQAAPDGRTRLILPGVGRPQSEFAADAGAIMGQHTGPESLFVRNDLLVEIQPVRVSKHASSLGFAPLKPVRAITYLEQFTQIGTIEKDEADRPVFVPRSMNENTAKALLASPQFRAPLPVVERILDIPQPILRPDNSIGYPRPGYDPEFRTFLNPGAHAIAALITPFCRGLFGRWNDRTPVWFYKANRERTGKDYLAALTSLLYEGRTNEDAPLNSDETETRKKLTASLIAGRRRIHFANCRGHINNAAFEMAATAPTWSDRRLGENVEVTLSNELEISLSGNTRLTYTADFANRCRVIMLHYEGEHANARQFTCKDLHGWLLQNRGPFVSALAALVNHWDRAGRPAGPSPFTSFPRWATVVGGVMHAAALGDPCLPMEEDGGLDGDRQTADMKALFALGHEHFGEEWVKKEQIYELVQTGDADLFSWVDLGDRNGKTKFGLLLRRFVGRTLGGIRLTLNAIARKSQQHTYQFTTSQGADPNDRRQLIFDGVFGGHLGHVGHVANPLQLSGHIEVNEKKEEEREERIYKGRRDVPNVPNLPIVDVSAIPAITDALSAQPAPIALDVETYGPRGDALDPWRGDIRLLSLAVPGHEPWLLDLKALGYDLGPLAPVLEAGAILGHNLKFDALWLRVKCGLRLTRFMDSMTAGRLLTAGAREMKNSLEALVERHLGVKLDKSAQTVPWGGQLAPAQLRYAAADVAHLHALHDALQKELRAAGLTDVYRLEMELLPHIVDMEARGFPVDADQLRAHHIAALRGSEEAAAQLRNLFGNPLLTPASVPQMKAALAGKGIVLASTREAALLESDDKAYIPQILAYRAAAKRAGMAEGLLDAVAPDGRIHSRFEPMGTDTGRFSSRDPNLQNIERGPIRAAFAAPAGHALVVADYSQIELRVAAAIADEQKMIDAYRKGIDLHRLTAALVLGKKPEEVTKEDRQLAKAVNFGLLYGQGARGLVGYAKNSYGVELTEDRAQVIRDRFFSAYPKLKAWQDASYAESADAKEIRTVTGRRQLLPAGDEARWPRFASSLNTPVQGGAADGIKRAIILIAQRLPPGCGLISTVHDELIALAPADAAAQAKAVIEATMIEAMSALFPTVPVEVECAVCQNWGEKK